MPCLYVPLGSVEWHGWHNVVGLDALKAHAVLCRVAEKAGGLVYPPIYTGTHSDNDNPHIFMIGKETLIALMYDLLSGFEKDGWRKVIILCGHYPNYHFVAKELAERWAEESHELKVLSLVENQVLEISGDHAARTETSMMMDLLPETVDLECIGGADAAEGVEGEDHDWLLNEDHPCYGVWGVDPRLSTPEFGREVNDRLVGVLADWVSEGTLDLEWF